MRLGAAFKQRHCLNATYGDNGDRRDDFGKTANQSALLRVTNS